MFLSFQYKNYPAPDAKKFYHQLFLTGIKKQRLTSRRSILKVSTYLNYQTFAYFQSSFIPKNQLMSATAQQQDSFLVCQ